MYRKAWSLSLSEAVGIALRDPLRRLVTLGHSGRFRSVLPTVVGHQRGPNRIAIGFPLN